MKAITCSAYGAPDVITIQDVAVPKPTGNEILVKVHAASLNSGDVRIRGLKVAGFMKIVMRLVLGITKPRKPILGTTFSGTIEAIGTDVSRFSVGEEVFGATGFAQGCHAEYVLIKENKVIVRKPAGMSHEEAAALPFGGQTAIYFLKKGKIDELKSPNVLIYGATGSVGVSAVQVAKAAGASVTAVCSSRGEALVRELGADRVVLYDQQSLTELEEQFDIIFDAVGKTNKKECNPLLKSNGVFLTVEGMDVAPEKTEYLEHLLTLVANHNYKAVVDKVFSIEEAVLAHTYVDGGKKHGNVVLKMTT